MANPTSRRPILKKNVEAFVPSPRFLSNSPARQPSSGQPTPAHISRPGQPLPPHVFSPSPSQQLLSPVPPAPANLFGGNTSAFNVDPGVPFLATVGHSDAGNSDKGSINKNESPKRFVGGFITELKKALTIKGSRRQSSKYQQAAEDIYSRPTTIRDSGYATSDRLEEPPANQPPPLTTFSPSPPPPPPGLLLTASEPPLNDYEATNDNQNDVPTAVPLDVLSPDSMASAISAHVDYGPDYAKMDRPTPPQSDVSLNTYMNRIQNFIHDLVALPWIAKERVTVDYRPDRVERDDKRLSHRPAIIWRSQDYNRGNYHLDSDSESSSLKMTPHLHVRPPSRVSRADINLGSEFSDETKSSLPYHPPNTVQTPDHKRVQSAGVRSGLEGEVKSSLPNTSKSPLPASSAQKLWEEPLPNATQMFVPKRGTAPTPLPNTLPLFPPNTGQTPEMSRAYVDDPRSEPQLGSNPGSRNGANAALLKTPSARKPSLTQKGGPEPLPPLPPNTSRTRSHGEDPRLGSRNDANPAFSNTASIRHRPASVQPSSNAGQRWDGTAKPDSSPPSNRLPRPGSGRQSTSGSSSRRSRRSHRSHTPSRRHESTDEWERFPEYRPGYVPYEYSENYYGTRYGVGIHGLLPPVRGVSSTAASPAPSIKQPQPQYPRSVLVTPPSASSSLRAS